MNLKKKRYFCFLFFLFIGYGNYSQCQDLHFSQFFAAPVSINPANIGNFNGDFRVSSNLRNQWAAFNNAYNSGIVTVDAPLLERRIGDASRLSGGIILYNDASGNGLLSQQSFALGLSFRKYLDVDLNHSIGIGFQGAYLNVGLNTNKADFEDELTVIGFTVPSQDPVFLNARRAGVFDFGAGLQYTGYFQDNFLVHLGYSLYHLNRFPFSFIDPTFKMPMRKTFHFGGYKSLGNKMYFHFSSQYQQQEKFKEVIAGGAFEHSLSNNLATNLAAYVGVLFRNFDTVNPYVGFERNNIKLGLTYDVGFISRASAVFSKLQTGELSVSWQLNKKTNTKYLHCPKF
jgi:type IX secretion system PorP/SprF family membrane protein